MATTNVHSKEIRDLKVSKGTGLTIGIASGNYSIGGNDGYYAGANNQAVTASTTNYIELDYLGVLAINTTGFSAGKLHVATVTTNGSAVTGVNDKRIFVTNGGLGLGTGQWASGTPTGLINGANTVFTLPGAPDTGVVLLVLDGALLNPAGNDYTISGNTITFVSAPLTGSTLVYFYTTSVPQTATPAYDIKTASGLVAVSSATAPTAGQTLIATNATTATWQDIIAKNLATTGAPVNVASAVPPSVDQVLRASAPTTSVWSNPKPFKWSTITASSTLDINTGNTINNASLVILTLPVTGVAVGDMFAIQGVGAGGWRVAQNAGQSIKDGASSTTVGAGGRIDSSNQYDTVWLQCIVANTTFKVVVKNGAISLT